MEPSKVLNREAFSRKEKCQSPNEPILAVRGYLCTRCWKPSDKMTKCSGCRRMYYCSKSCQKLDWDLRHKKHCKLFRDINSAEENATAAAGTWKQFQEHLWTQLLYIKSKSTDPLPRDTIQGQSYCSTCYCTAIQGAAFHTKLLPCDTCHMIFTCENCVPSHSEGQCLDYQSRNEVELFRIEHFELSGESQCMDPMSRPRNAYRRLSTAANWIDYLANISDKDFLKTFVYQNISLSNLRSLKFPGTPDVSRRSDVQRVVMYQLLTTETLTMPVSIVAALEDSGQSLLAKESISLHLVGAGTKEFHGLAMFEEMLHLVPSLKHLKVTLIGTSNEVGNTENLSNDVISNGMQSECCQECSKSGRTRTMFLYRGLYHDYARTKSYSKPDMAVLFHSGRTQAAQDSWKPTTRFLVNSETLTFCTTYNEQEAVEEAVELETMKARFVVRPEVNKWRSMVPCLELLDDREHTVYYHNYYRYLFQGTV